MKRSMFLVAAALAGAVALAGCSKSPESTVEGFYTSLGKGDISTAKGYLSSQLVTQFGDAKISSALASEAQRIQACGGVKNVAVSMQGEGDIRRGMATVSYGKCPDRQEQTALVKENGSWKISANK